VIDVNSLCRDFEEKIQTYAADTNQAYDREFVIYSTVGDRKPNHRIPDSNNVTKYMYGVFEMLSSSLTPLSGLTIAQMSATVTFICDLYRADTDNITGEHIESERLVKFLNSFVQTHNGTVSNGVLTYYSLTSVGTAEIASSETGEFVPISLSIYYVYVNNGYFGEDVKLRIDGVRMWYTAFSETNNKTIESALMYGEKRAKSVAAEIVNGIDFTVPLTEENRAIFSENNDANVNQWHWVSIQVGDNTPKTYRMILSSCVKRSEPTLVTSVTASMVEAIPRLSTPWADAFEEIGNFTHITNPITNPITTDANTAKTKGITVDEGYGYVLIEWGDGEWSEIAPGMSRTQKHTYSSSGTKSINIHPLKHAKE
jgi:hypothetical protein